MPTNRRRSVRLRFHDYRGGLYFITICTRNRRRLFGDVVDGEMALSVLGRIAHDECLRTGRVRLDVVLDAFVVMPDHVHLLFGITDSDDRRGTARRALDPAAPNEGTACRAPTDDWSSRRQVAQPDRETVPTIVRAYKSAVTRAVNLHRQSPGAPVWQRGYYDRVVRSDREAEAVRRYIEANPPRWRNRATDRRDGHWI